MIKIITITERCFCFSKYHYREKVYKGQQEARNKHHAKARSATTSPQSSPPPSPILSSSHPISRPSNNSINYTPPPSPIPSHSISLSLSQTPSSISLISPSSAPDIVCATLPSPRPKNSKNHKNRDKDKVRDKDTNNKDKAQSTKSAKSHYSQRPSYRMPKRSVCFFILSYLLVPLSLIVFLYSFIFYLFLSSLL